MSALNHDSSIELYTENLTIGYARHGHPLMVQEHLQLQLRKGELVCLVGPNGCGKSTLLHTLAGLQKPLAGSIILQDKDLCSYSTPEKAKLLSLTLTDRVEVDKMSVFDLVSMGRYPYTNRFGKFSPDDITTIEQAIEQVHLSEKKKWSLDTLSDGERQRAMIAKVLAQATPVLLFDEPTSHLDLTNRVSTLLLLKTVAKAFQVAVLLSTHELEMAMQLADQIWLMSNESMAVGATEQLIANGSFQHVFQSDLFTFDAMARRFIIHNVPE
ncbi:ABC transporter ATP-binding protein [Microbacter margulisiae]|uniref:Iron complex transport system ATP-binding protein n=1 Tax=Microbacter margulisiae TaxID=1350067 RepID=A0A7W5DQV3_9PORP|nr:ABC transporter ATP-binding protein [Microbacter margulisiae]MBB3187420.1 iron complex transport system ATP-binding protein [Microbacter margulisiae]